jgi:hypothetical protein
MYLENNSEPGKVESSITVKRITAVWALSETTFGGLLHALHIPLTGIFVGGAAVIFITLIGYFSEQKYSIIKATLIVLILKGIVSPYTPLTAYFSVLLQGILGQALFINKKHVSISAFILSITTLLVFGFQKVIVLTIVFGNTIWQSLDTFADFLIKQFNFSSQNFQSLNFSLMIISIYVFIHMAAGVLIGIIAGRIPKWITSSVKSNKYILQDHSHENEVIPFLEFNKKRKGSGRKKKAGFLTGFALITLLLSYLITGINSNFFFDVVIMSLRAVIITLIWYFYLAPVLVKYARRFLRKRQSNYTKEVEEIILLFPRLKNILAHSWIRSSEYKGIRKYRLFLSYSLITMLFTNFNFE